MNQQTTFTLGGRDISPSKPAWRPPWRDPVSVLALGGVTVACAWRFGPAGVLGAIGLGAVGVALALAESPSPVAVGRLVRGLFVGASAALVYGAVRLLVGGTAGAILGGALAFAWGFESRYALVLLGAPTLLGAATSLGLSVRDFARWVADPALTEPADIGMAVGGFAGLIAYVPLAAHLVTRSLEQT